MSFTISGSVIGNPICARGLRDANFYGTVALGSASAGTGPTFNLLNTGPNVVLERVLAEVGWSSGVGTGTGSATVTWYDSADGTTFAAIKTLGVGTLVEGTTGSIQWALPWPTTRQYVRCVVATAGTVPEATCNVALDF